jgi:hypothetical protein
VIMTTRFSIVQQVFRGKPAAGMTAVGMLAVVLVLGCCVASPVYAGFGIQTAGPNAFSAVVSNSADPGEPLAANPGDLNSQAGAHPFDVTTNFWLNTEPALLYPEELRPKDTFVNLPAGFAGSVASVPRCTWQEFTGRTGPVSDVENNFPAGCPTSTQVGVVKVSLDESGEIIYPPFLASSSATFMPVYNMVPPAGSPAELGFTVAVAGQPVFVSVRSDGDYGLVARVQNISEYVSVVGVSLTLWGVPADSRHDSQRFTPAQGSFGHHFRPGDENGNPLPASVPPVPFLSNPTHCTTEPLDATVSADAWAAPGRYNADGEPDLSDPNWVTASTPVYPRGITGCSKLAFTPSISAKPDTGQADSPSGLAFDLSVPQTDGPNDLATPALRDAVVSLPAGVSISPGRAAGLAGCSEAQVGIGNNAQPACPNAAQIGTVEVTTPLLPGVLEGQVYLGSERSGSTYHVFMVIRGEGLLIKLAGRIEANPVTGQLTTMFENLPQVQFSDLRLHFFGGPQGALATPEACGTYTTTSLLTPWSAPEVPMVSPSDSFTIDSGCVNGFSPSFSAGTTNNQAGGFSPFSVTFSRSDEDQGLGGISVTTPPGLLGLLKSVQLCGEPQASQGMCSEGSLVGHTTAGAGPGLHPFYLGGSVYLTGPYKGAPFGLSVVVPAVAGPFNLGNVVIRAAISIDPHTAQITVMSDPLPTILDGIPLRIRTVNVSIDRSGFMFNPTNCEPLAVGGTITSTQGASAGVSSRFQAANCAALPFKPVFSVSTQAKTSKQSGASLTVKSTFPTGEANVHSVAVVLPKQLPARLTTIQQACPEATFAANPASCPAGSNIGVGTASTPVLANPVTGPAYLVSHGGAAFPDVVVILQGEGVTVDLVGSIDIKKGITSSTFATVPDAPIGSFQLVLPEGPHSGLAAVLPAKAKGNMCGQALTMPFTTTGQNGAVVKQTAKIAVVGCPKAAPKKKTPKKQGKK